MHPEAKVDVSYKTTYEDCALPEGWKKVAHRSGLFCFQHESSGVIVWSQPYTLSPDPTTGSTSEDRVQNHRPPIEIFAAGCGMKQPNVNRSVKMVQAEGTCLMRVHARSYVGVAIIKRLVKASRRPQGGEDESDAPAEKSNNGQQPSRKRPLPEEFSDEGKAPPPAPRAKIYVNGFLLDDPVGRTAMEFLEDYSQQSLGAVPEYVETMSNGTSIDCNLLLTVAVDAATPYHCDVLINNKPYGHGMDTTKPLARQRAAEIALEALCVLVLCSFVQMACRVPGFWATHKQTGNAHQVTNLAPATVDTTLAVPAAPSNASSSDNTPQSIEEFQALAIDDPRVFQGCLYFSIKTPAQLLTEFQTKNKGVAVNYANSTVIGNAAHKFKVIASVGPTTAEGFANNKKLAKQYAAQSLLAKLNPQVRTYHELVCLHENNVKQHAEHVKREKNNKISSKYGGNASNGPNNVANNNTSNNNSNYHYNSNNRSWNGCDNGYSNGHDSAAYMPQYVPPYTGQYDYSQGAATSYPGYGTAAYNYGSSGNDNYHSGQAASHGQGWQYSNPSVAASHPASYNAHGTAQGLTHAVVHSYHQAPASPGVLQQLKSELRKTLKH
ncbi:unnamed protein product [Aphanomyces euteiches]